MKLMLGAVRREEVPDEHALFRETLCSAPPVPMMRCNCRGGSQAQARNRVASNFLRSDCSDLLFIDSDCVPELKHIPQILAHDFPIVSGCYLKRKDGEPAWSFCALDLGEIRSGSIIPAKYLPCGFLRIQKRVFIAMLGQMEDELRYDAGDDTGQDTLYNFFGPGIFGVDGRRVYLEEDYAFSLRARQCGFDLMVDTGIIVTHLGRAAFPLEHQWASMRAAGLRDK